MARLGPDAVTMRNIASEAGVTTGALTHYFDRKDDIVSAALELICEDMLDRLRTAPAATLEGLLELLARALPLEPGQRDDWRLWLAFWARADGEALQIDETEIESAAWFSREALVNSPEDENFRLPRRDSIARRLIEDWLAETA